MADAKATLAIVGEDQTAAAFRSALGNVESFAAQAKGLLEGAFALGGAGIAVEWVKGITELSDGLVKGAERAGVAQQQFNNLAAAFNEADISTESLSKGFKFLEVNISKAAAGNQAMADAFNELGLSAEALKRLAPEVQMEAFAEAVSRVSDPTDRARLGAQTMGRAFLELEPKLLAGAEALDKLAASANGLDAATTENLAKFNQELNKTGQFFKGWAAWNLDGLFEKLNAFGDFFSPDLETRIRRIQTELASPANFDASTVERKMKELAELIAQSDALAAAKKPTANVEAALAEQGKGKLEAIKGMLAEIDKNWTFITDKWTKQRNEQLAQEDRETQTIGDKRIEFEKKVNDLFLAGRINRSEAAKRDDRTDNQRLDRLAKQQVAADIADSIKETQKEWAESMRLMTEDARAAMENARAQFEETRRIAQSAAQSMQDAFAQFLFHPFNGGLRQMLLSFVNILAEMEAKAASAQLFKAVFGGGSGLGGIFESFLGGGASTDITFNQPLPNTVPVFATGASWKVGGSGGTDSQLVRFRASPDETVSVTRPGQAAANAMPAVQFSPVYHFGSGVSRTDVVQACAATQRATIAEMTKLIRGGRFG